MSTTLSPIVVQWTHFPHTSTARFIRGRGTGWDERRRAARLVRGAVVHPGRFSVLIARKPPSRWKTAFSLMRFAFHALIDGQYEDFIFQTQLGQVSCWYSILSNWWTVDVCFLLEMIILMFFTVYDDFAVMSFYYINVYAFVRLFCTIKLD